MLSYTLAPHATYPHQLRQAVELLRYTLTELKHSPSDVSIAGDSAGANLALGLLSHLLHPHPEIPSLELSAPLATAILLAPWSSFRTDWPSTTYNSQKDVVGPYANDMWYKSFLGGRPRDAYNEPLSAAEGWWGNLEGKVREILVCGGSDEVLVDSIRELNKVLGVSEYLRNYVWERAKKDMWLTVCNFGAGGTSKYYDGYCGWGVARSALCCGFGWGG